MRNVIGDITPAGKEGEEGAFVSNDCLTLIDMTIKIGLAQIQPISAKEGIALEEELESDTLFRTLKGNLEQVEEHIRQAKRDGADIIIFPEYFLQGILNEKRQYLALPSVHLEARIGELAKEYGIGIAGTIVQGRIRGESFPRPPESSPFDFTPSDWKVYLRDNKAKIEKHIGEIALENEAFLFDTQGNLCGNYVKRNLWHPEREYLSPGHPKGRVFDTPWGRVGFLICWDLSHPAAMQTLVDQHADLVIMPTYWLAIDSEPMVSRYNKDPDYELKVVQALALSRAFEGELVLAMVNAGGPREEGFMGGSGVWAPLLGRIDGYAASQVGRKIVEIDLDLLKDARETYKIREDWADKEIR